MEINRRIQNILARNDSPVIHSYYNAYLKGNKQPTTAKVFLNNVIKFLNYLRDDNGIDINKFDSFTTVKHMHIIGYFNSISTKTKADGTQTRLKATTKNGMLAAIKDFFEFLRFNDYIVTNPCDKVKLQKETEVNEIVYLTTEEIKRVKNEIWRNGGDNATRDYAIFMLGIRTGMRETAITEINISDIDRENLMIRNVVEKGNYKQDKYITANTLEIIDDWLAERPECDTDALFTSVGQRGKLKGVVKRIKQWEVERMIKGYTECLGKHITPHKMRSTCATQLFEVTNDIYTVAETIGHRNIQNTRKYAAVSQNRKRGIIANLDNI